MLVHWMIAHDLDNTADAAAEAAAFAADAVAAARPGARPRLVLCHVAHPVPVVVGADVIGLPDPGGYYAVDVEGLGARLRERAAELARAHPQLDVDAVVCRGPTVPTLLDEAERQHVDAIAVGSHNRRGVARLVLGSTAAALVAHAQKPVLVVKPAARSPAG